MAGNNTLPNANVAATGGGLGRTEPSTDGVALMIIGMQAATGIVLGTIMGPFYSANDASNAGITKPNAAVAGSGYDAAKSLHAYKHIADFYEEAGNGTELWVMPVAQTVTYSAMVDVAVTTSPLNVAIQTIGDNVRLVGLVRNPTAALAVTAGLPSEINNATTGAIVKAQAFIYARAAVYKPISILIEGRQFNGTVAAATNLRTTFINCNRVSLVIGQDYAFASTFSDQRKNYACLGKALGKLAGNSVSRNIGRVKSGPLVGITAPGISSNTAMSGFTDVEIDLLNEKGYIFMRMLETKLGKGIYFNESHTCALISDDCFSIENGRSIDKAIRRARLIYVAELLNDVPLVPSTGKYMPSVIKKYQSDVEQDITEQMIANEELSGVSCYVDPNQDVVTTGVTNIDLNLLPRGYTRYINVKVGFKKSL